MLAKDVILACDFPSAAETFAFLEKLGDVRPFLKIGMELFYAEGRQIVEKLKNRGHKIFLDLKIHDIPATAEKSMAVLAKLSPDMVNLHAAGTKAMMEAALSGLSAAENKPLLIAVTQLTSTSEPVMREELWISKSLPETVLHYAENAKMAGLDGVVCSPLEVSAIKQTCGGRFITVTPGIRLATDAQNDQVRIATPAKARESGADFIVVGRPITSASDPAEAYARCKTEFFGGDAHES